MRQIMLGARISKEGFSVVVIFSDAELDASMNFYYQSGIMGCESLDLRQPIKEWTTETTPSSALRQSFALWAWN